MPKKTTVIKAEEAAEELMEVIPAEKRSFLKREASDLSEQIEQAQIKNRESYESALGLALANKWMLSQIEAWEEAFIRPFAEALAAQRKRFSALKGVLESNDETIRKKLKGYQGRVDISAIKTIHVQDYGRVTIQERNDFEVIDESLVPREYLKVDEAKIGRAVRAGLVKDGEIPGVRVKKELTTAFVLNKK